MAEQDIAVGDQAFALEAFDRAGEARRFPGGHEKIVVHRRDRGEVDRVLLVAAHHRDFAHAGLADGADQAAEQRLAAHLDHAFRPILGEPPERRPAAGGEQDRALLAGLGREIPLLGLRQLVVAGKLEHLLHADDGLLDPGDGFLAPDPAARVAHGGDRRAQVVVGPDGDRDARLAKGLGRGRVVFGRHDHDWAAVVPCLSEGENFVGGGFLGMDQNRVRPGGAIGLGALERLLQPPAGDQRLDPGDDAEIVVHLAVLAGLDLAAEFVDGGERLALADERVGLGKKLVLDADAGDPALAQFPHRAAHVVEIAPAGIAVDQDRDRAGVGHELQDFQDLRPGRFVAVAHAKRRRHGKARGPDALEAGFLDDLGRHPVVGFHQEFQLGRGDQLPKLAEFGGAGLGQGGLGGVRLGFHAAFLVNFPSLFKGNGRLKELSRPPIIRAGF